MGRRSKFVNTSPKAIYDKISSENPLGDVNYRQRSLELLSKEGFNVFYDNGENTAILYEIGSLGPRLYRPFLFNIVNIIKGEEKKGKIFANPELLKNKDLAKLFLAVSDRITDILNSMDSRSASRAK